MGGAPDGEVADELVVDVRWQCPLPGRQVGRTSLLGFVGDALGQMLDPVGEPVEVVAVLRVLPQDGWGTDADRAAIERVNRAFTSPTRPKMGQEIDLGGSL